VTEWCCSLIGAYTLIVISITFGKCHYGSELNDVVKEFVFFQTEKRGVVFMYPLCEKGVLYCICLEMHQYVQAPFWSAVVEESNVI
jgi:hypothetical protein